MVELRRSTGMLVRTLQGEPTWLAKGHSTAKVTRASLAAASVQRRRRPPCTAARGAQRTATPRALGGGGRQDEVRASGGGLERQKQRWRRSFRQPWQRHLVRTHGDDESEQKSERWRARVRRRSEEARAYALE